MPWECLGVPGIPQPVLQWLRVYAGTAQHLCMKVWLASQLRRAGPTDRCSNDGPLTRCLPSHLPSSKTYKRKCSRLPGPYGVCSHARNCVHDSTSQLGAIAQTRTYQLRHALVGCNPGQLSTVLQLPLLFGRSTGGPRAGGLHTGVIYQLMAPVEVLWLQSSMPTVSRRCPNAVKWRLTHLQTDPCGIEPCCLSDETRAPCIKNLLPL